MTTFIISIIALVAGYAFYSKYLERVMEADPQRITPASTLGDGVDYVPMPWWRVFLIQFLNIAGLGPIFGAIAGAMWGPVAFLWIVLGTIFAGGVHDYFSGMLSVRHDGKSITEIIGIYLGKQAKQVMRIFAIVLLILVGVVFISGPAGLLAGLTPKPLDFTFWVWVVFIYYILATLLPIDKIIGKIYPVFGFALLFMAVSLIVALMVKGYHIPELSAENFKNFHHNKENLPVFPMMFITIACGAISGFHATQSPLMARCLKNEKEGRKVFYGAMAAEGVVALVWAAISMSFFNGMKGLNDVMIAQGGNAAWVVNEVSYSLLGTFGAILAILGVVAAPITSGDTAFRSARLTIADLLKTSQKPVKNRLMITIPLFATGFLLTKINFDVIWRYFAWANQTLAAVVLWTITVYLCRKKNKYYLITLIPALFMTAVVTTYIMLAPEGLSLPKPISYGIGLFFVILTFTLFFIYKKKLK
ncbi:Carbon starvation protein CstA [Porphyromonadaceae bacterium KH3R12]|jgi:carbon starvation protein CstA|uniref:carbon starvation CstA family protein n=1 Tax=Proteiniphilum saccharofermentans TaxID=1642647 RepID=UPI0008969B4C|nr:carbon starvation protein A [Proteiniphilum saccharofermentans]SEA31053.1 Carbon starvation protein CstA [Porphyromonadaceae bacterium KH3R12]